MGGAPAELDARLGRLWRARTGAAPRWNQPFDVCDDVSGGPMSEYCAVHGERVAAVERKARKRAATADMPRELDAAAKRFFDARAASAVALTGSLRARLSIEERAKLEDAYVTLLEQLRDPTTPDTVSIRRPALWRATVAAGFTRRLSCG